MKFKLNPVLKREIKTTQRGVRFPVVLGAYNILMLLMLVLLVFPNFKKGSGISLDSIFPLYYALLYTQLCLILFIVPALMASTITGERQSGTLDILLVSSASYGMIIRGKLYAGLFNIVVLIFSSLPHFAVLAMLGNISFEQIVINTFYFLLVAIMIGCVSISLSVRSTKTNAATVQSYVFILFISLLTVLFTYLIRNVGMFYNGISFDFQYILYLNPFVGLMTLLDLQLNTHNNLLTSFPNYKPLSVFVIHLILYAGISAIALSDATKRLDPNRH